MTKTPRLTRISPFIGYEFHFKPTDQVLSIEKAYGKHGGWTISCRGRAVGQGFYPSLRAVREHIGAALEDAANGYKVRW